jgi:hypothetical protein
VDNVVASTELSNKGLSPLGAESSGKAELIRREATSSCGSSTVSGLSIVRGIAAP